VTHTPDDDSNDLPDEEPKHRVLSTLVAALLLAGTGSGSAWLWWTYGNGATFPSFIAEKAVAAVDQPVGSNDSRAFQKQIIGSMQSNERLLSAQQAEIKRLSDQVSMLAGKLDLLPRPIAVAQAAIPGPKPMKPAPQKKPREDKPAGAISTGGAPLAAPLQLSR
jgi:hypothetical protein